MGGYLTLLTLDMLKSLSVVKYGIDPLWSWKMKDAGYMIACSFAAITIVVATKTGIAKLKDRATKAMVLKHP